MDGTLVEMKMMAIDFPNSSPQEERKALRLVVHGLPRIWAPRYITLRLHVGQSEIVMEISTSPGKVVTASLDHPLACHSFPARRQKSALHLRIV